MTIMGTTVQQPPNMSVPEIWVAVGMDNVDAVEGEKPAVIAAVCILTALLPPTHLDC